MRDMRVSIITASYNSEKTIRATLDSVISQTYENIQHIVIDGASTDQTTKILSEYGNISDSMTWISETDKGIYEAFNKGVLLSDGNIIFFLNSDDVFYDNEVIEKIVDEFEENCDLNFVLCSVLVLRPQTQFVVRRQVSRYMTKMFMRAGIMPPHPGVFCRREVFQTVGTFSKKYKIAGDFDWLLRGLVISKLNYKIANIISVKMSAGGVSNDGFRSYVIITAELFRSFVENGMLVFCILLPFRFLFKIHEFAYPFFNRQR